MKTLFCFLALLLCEMGLCQKKQIEQTLYIATDKDIYTNNETIWFAGYIMKNSDINGLNTDILTVSLTKKESNKTILIKKFMIEKGLCAGSLLLPDTIQSGSYELYAFTNLVDKDSTPIGHYSQMIEVKSFSRNSFMVDFKRLDTYSNDDSVALAFHISPNDPMIMKKVNIQYLDVKGKERSIKMDKQDFKIIKIPKNNLPASEIHFISTYLGEKQENDIPITTITEKKEVPSIGIYPEGGFIINNIENSIIWEYKSTKTLSQPVRALLLENESILDTVQTDKWGVGKFNIKPKDSKLYSLKLLDNDSLPEIIKLPVAINKGVASRLKNVIVDDTLAVILNTETPQEIYFGISNINTDSIEISKTFKIKKGQSLKIPINNILKGLNTITFFDSLKRPLSEHLFFAHYNKRSIALIQTDSNFYSMRAPIKVTVQIQDPNMQPQSGVFTISCVQQNRVFPNRKWNIDSYYFIGHLLDSIRNTNDASLYDNIPYLTDMILTRGWRKYKWLSDSALIQGKNIKNIQLEGKVVKKNKPIKKPETLTLTGALSTSIITTGVLGHFVLDVEQTVIEENRKAFLMLNSHKTDEDYKILLDTTFQRMAHLRRNIPLLDDDIFIKGMVDSIKDNTNSYAKNVVVQTKNGNDFYKTNNLGLFKKNECGDYVCLYNVLNCPNHPFGGTLPVKFHTYRSPGGGIVTYTGCLLEEKKTNGIESIIMDGIYTAREFYGMDSVALSQPDKEYLSTIYWNPFVFVDNTGKAQLTFYSSDISDYYDIIIQGMNWNNDTFYSQKRIRIKAE